MSNLKNNSIIQLIALCPDCDWSIRPMTDEEKNSTSSNDPEHPEMSYALEIPGHRVWASQKEIIEFFGWYPFREQAKPKFQEKKNQPEVKKHGLRCEHLDKTVSNRTASEVMQNPPKFPKLSTKPIERVIELSQETLDQSAASVMSEGIPELDLKYKLNKGE